MGCAAAEVHSLGFSGYRIPGIPTLAGRIQTIPFTVLEAELELRTWLQTFVRDK